jgi:hypothetical protein
MASHFTRRKRKVKHGEHLGKLHLMLYLPFFDLFDGWTDGYQRQGEISDQEC